MEINMAFNLIKGFINTAATIRTEIKEKNY